MLNIPLPITGPASYAQPGTQQQVPGTDLSRDPFDQSGSARQLELERQSRERTAAITLAAGRQVPPQPSEGSLPMTVGSRYNPNGSPTGVTVAAPTAIQDPFTRDYESGAGGPTVTTVPTGLQPISLSPGSQVLDPVQDAATRPALGDPTRGAAQPTPGRPAQTDDQTIKTLKKLAAASGDPLVPDARGGLVPASTLHPATGVTSASSPLDYLPLVGAVVVAFILFGAKK